MDELTTHGVIGEVRSYFQGQELPVGRLNHYVTDGAVSVANLQTPDIDLRQPQT